MVFFFFFEMKKPGARVLYLGAASGTTVSHVSDVVGPVSSFPTTVVLIYLIYQEWALMGVLFFQNGVVYAVEFSHRSGRDLVNMAKKRTNVIPIIEDARHPAKYRMLVGMVDVIFSDVAQPDQVCYLFNGLKYLFIWTHVYKNKKETYFNFRTS